MNYLRFWRHLLEFCQRYPYLDRSAARFFDLRQLFGQPPWRSFVHWLGNMDCFWLLKAALTPLRRFAGQKPRRMIIDEQITTCRTKPSLSRP